MAPSKISTKELGDIRLGIQTPRGLGIKWLGFKDSDRTLSKDVFIDNYKKLDFLLEGEKLAARELFIYLGKDWQQWDKDFALPMYLQDSEPGKGIFTWTAEHNKAEEMQKSLWSAGLVIITLCLQRGQPIVDASGRPVSTTLQWGYDAWYRGLYDYVRENLDMISRQANITSPVTQFSSIIEAARVEAEGSKYLERYLRIKSHLSQLQQSVEDLLKRPAYRLIQQVESISTNQLGPSSMAHAHRHGNKIVALQRVQRVGPHFIPASFTVTGVAKTYDISENRLIASTLDSLEKQLSDIKDELSRFIDNLQGNFDSAYKGIIKDTFEVSLKRHKQKQKELELDIRRCSLYRQKLNVSAVLPSDIQAFSSSELFNYDMRYQQVRKLKSILDNLDSYLDTSEGAIPFQMAAFCEVYAEWSLHRIVKSLEKFLGFISVYKADALPFYHHPYSNDIYRKMKHPKLDGVSLNIYFERRYPFFETRDRTQHYGYHRDSGVHPPRYTPDIALEFHGVASACCTQCPLIITLDPTLGGSDDWKSKFEYKKSLRCFLKSPNERVYPRIVRAAWAVAPGQESHNALFSLEDEHLTEGVIFLNHRQPDDEGLASVLRQIINNVVPGF